MSVFNFNIVKPLSAGEDIVYYSILKCLNFSISNCHKEYFKDSVPYYWFGIVDIMVLTVYLNKLYTIFSTKAIQ